MAMVGIAPEDDDGEGAMGRDKQSEKKSAGPPKASEAQIKKIHMDAKGLDENKYRELLGKYGVKSSKELTVEQASKLIEELNSAPVAVGDTATAVKPTVPEKGTIAQKTDTPTQNNEQPMRNLGDLFRACKAYYNLTPTQVCKELGVSEKESIADIDDAWAQIKAIKGN